MTSHRPHSRFLNALVGLLPPDRVTTDPAALDGLRRDQTHVLEPGAPVAAVAPASAEEVAAVLRLASAHGVPVVPRGAGSGLAGGAMATDGCLILSLLRMNRIVEIDVEDMVAVVQPGVITAHLAAAVAEAGLFYAPDPSSFEISTIGGNLATNAGGLSCLKYGVTRESVLGIEVVLADGMLLRTGRRSVKGVSGYDLTALFIGSEGTLGVITEATLRLRSAPLPSGTLLASFPSLADAGRAVGAITASEASLSTLELMDQTTVRAVEDWQHVGLDRDAAAVLIARSDTRNYGQQDLAAVESACRANGAGDVLRATDALESEGLMATRRAALPALERLGLTLLEDVAVPLGKIVALLDAIARIAERHAISIGTFGHVGDGNLHPTLVIPRGDGAAIERAMAAAAELLRTTIDLGGTLSGEHGIGLLKLDQLPAEIGPAGVHVSRLIKDCLDPAGILNPGKVVSLASRP